ncbi:MAG: DUF4411 family protein [Bacteroidales bacterium]|nr:DUF4411 family protein [Bacteroidales bacterium]
MKVVIDTSSLLALVRYYLPFDDKNVLFDFFKKKILNKEIIILDKVVEECKYTSKGIVIKTLDYINDKKNKVNTSNLLPTKKFYNQLENQFVYGSVKNKLSPTEFENMKNHFLQSADAKLILYSLDYKKSNEIFEDGVIIVTEETSTENDNKFIKKIPQICNILDLEVKTLPDLLSILDGININY